MENENKNNVIKSEDGEITLSSIIGKIFKRKILFVVITLFVLILGVLFFSLIYNKSSKVYSASFNYQNSTLVDGEYLDTSNFNYKDLVTLEYLTTAKASNSEFASIDVTYMANGSIKIELVEEYVISNGTKIINDSYYKISALQKHFKSAEQAKKFLIALINVPQKKNILISETFNYMSNLDNFDNALTYENKINYMKAQKSLLENKYNELINQYGDISLEDNKHLSDLQNEMKKFFDNNNISNLEMQLSAYGFVYDYNYSMDILNLELSNLNKELALAQAKLESVVNKLSGFTGIQISNLDVIKELTAQIEEIKQEINNVELKIANKDNSTASFITKKTAFNQKLSEIRAKLEEFTVAYSETEQYVLEDANVVVYRTSGVISSEGGVGILFSGLVSIILGLVAACVVNLLVDYIVSTKNKKKENCIDSESNANENA